MAKPVAIATGKGLDWKVIYTDKHGEVCEMVVFGNSTIDDALRDARGSLDSTVQDYVIIAIQLINDVVDIPENQIV